MANFTFCCLYSLHSLPRIFCMYWQLQWKNEIPFNAVMMSFRSDFWTDCPCEGITRMKKFFINHDYYYYLFGIDHENLKISSNLTSLTFGSIPSAAVRWTLPGKIRNSTLRSLPLNVIRALHCIHILQCTLNHHNSWKYMNWSGMLLLWWWWVIYCHDFSLIHGWRGRWFRKTFKCEWTFFSFIQPTACVRTFGVRESSHSRTVHTWLS